jgi:CheY-like chemotaxis protein
VLAVHEHWHVFRTGRDNLVSERERVGASHRVVTANSGREALERIASEHYDVILTDIRMPDLDERALYEEIKRRWPELAERVVFVTGDT